MSLTSKKEKYKQLSSESEVLSPDEAHARVITELAQTKVPELMTELSNSEIKALSIVMTLAEATENTVFEIYGNWFMKLRVSLRRKGRGELISVSRSGRDVEEKVRKGMMKLFTR